MSGSTTVENVRQIGPVFFKTKPICRRDKIHVSAVLTKDYEEKRRLAGRSKQSQTKPISNVRASEIGAKKCVFSAESPVCWPEARSSEGEILSRLAASTTFREGRLAWPGAKWAIALKVTLENKAEF